jgi:thioredoxin reductase (NADPH)
LNEVAIVGCGPAGIAAAIYLMRAGYEPLVFEKKEIGGLLENANLVENYPGFPEGIGGKELVKLFQNQLHNLGINVKIDDVKSVNFKKGFFNLKTNKYKYRTKVVIIAIGTNPKNVDLKGQSDLIGKKLFYEIKDIPSPKGEDTFVIIGGGDAAFDYALNLAKNVERVDIIFRGKNPKCLSLLEKRVKDKSNIHLHPKTYPMAVEETGDQITIKFMSDEKKIAFTADYALIACGREPNLSILSDEIQGSLKIKEDGSSNFPSLFFAGDVRRGEFRQTGIAVGDGIMCAMQAVEFLKGEDE